MFYAEIADINAVRHYFNVINGNFVAVFAFVKDVPDSVFSHVRHRGHFIETTVFVVFGVDVAVAFDDVNVSVLGEFAAYRELFGRERTNGFADVIERFIFRFHAAHRFRFEYVSFGKHVLVGVGCNELRAVFNPVEVFEIEIRFGVDADSRVGACFYVDALESVRVRIYFVIVGEESQSARTYEFRVFFTGDVRSDYFLVGENDEISERRNVNHVRREQTFGSRDFGRGEIYRRTEFGFENALFPFKSVIRSVYYHIPFINGTCVFVGNYGIGSVETFVDPVAQEREVFFPEVVKVEIIPLTNGQFVFGEIGRNDLFALEIRKPRQNFGMGRTAARVIFVSEFGIMYGVISSVRIAVFHVENSLYPARVNAVSRQKFHLDYVFQRFEREVSAYDRAAVVDGYVFVIIPRLIIGIVYQFEFIVEIFSVSVSQRAVVNLVVARRYVEISHLNGTHFHPAVTRCGNVWVFGRVRLFGKTQRNQPVANAVQGDFFVENVCVQVVNEEFRA